MFWRKQKAAIERFHPLHKALTLEKGISVSLRRDDWEPVIQSLARHQAEIRRRKWRLHQRVPAVLVPLLRVLAADMPPDGVLSVSADMRGPNVPGKAGPPSDLPVQRPLIWMKQWYAFDPWLRIRAELRDGSVLELDVTDRVRFRKRKKRNPRGKVKVKTKTKTTQLVRVTRRLAKGAVVRQPASPPPRGVRVQVKQGKHMAIRVNGKLYGVQEGKAMLARILDVSTEPFRWTPPGTPARRTK
ncbi:hypothetical protein E1293_23010 [Actinomadura darangshiensis]|uniref:Uncharacterized protein n=1 Tax=Actinomadura darangshiensis TaxID=705336 RepID=A0A4R5B5C1_9ACTN|nr:hypothetical protein [Actinomadura darangshiensis]TDD79546.1 hypothetical protein E1293_23010 [Actinomadura darangshiensis]